jgi:hypothetical protein
VVVALDTQLVCIDESQRHIVKAFFLKGQY